MENENSGAKKGFTLTEVLMSVAIMSIMASVMVLNFHAADQTPKREAEKLALYIARLTQKSDRIKISFDVEIPDNANLLHVSWKKHGDNMETLFYISGGLKYQLVNCTNNILTYDRINYPRGAKIDVLSSITDYANHKHIAITASPDNNSLPYYVLITAGDKVQ